MRPRNHQEFEVMGCIALFILLILALVLWALYERGNLGIALAIAGGLAVFAGLIRAFQAWIGRRNRARRKRHHQQEGRQKRLGQEQERQPGSGRQPIRSEAQERRQEEERQRDPLKRNALIRRIDEISNREFERLMAHYFRHQGYSVDTTPASGHRGADLLAAADERRIAILLKRQDSLVGNRAVREALVGRAFYGAYEAWLITNNAFTREAHNDARVAGVRLIDGNELAEWLSKLLDQLEDEPQ